MYLFIWLYAWGHAQSSDHAHLIFKTVPPLLKLAKHRCATPPFSVLPRAESARVRPNIEYEVKIESYKNQQVKIK
jgi:hypothetical protein